MDDYDYLFKCVIVGDGGTGKTAMVVRFSQGFFQESYKLTIGVEFAVKSIILEHESDRHVVKLQIWDTGGQDRFVYVRPLYYKGAMGCIVVFDLTNRESFAHIARWIAEVQKESGAIPMLLVGNKSDLRSARVIPRSEAEKLANDLNMLYIESSAKSGKGVGDVFAILAYLMMGEQVPQKLLEFQDIAEDSTEHVPTVVDIPSTSTPTPSLSPSPARNENLDIPSPPKVEATLPPPSRPSLHAPVVRMPVTNTTQTQTQKISEPEWFAPKVSPRPSPLSTAPSPPQPQPQSQPQHQPRIIPRQEPMVIKPKPIPKTLPASQPSLPREPLKSPPQIVTKAPLVPPTLPSPSSHAPQVPPKPIIQSSTPPSSQQNPFLVQSKESSRSKQNLFSQDFPTSPAPRAPPKKQEENGTNFSNFLNVLQKSPLAEKKAPNLFAKPEPQIIRPKPSSGFLNKNELPKKAKAPNLFAKPEPQIIRPKPSSGFLNKNKLPKKAKAPLSRSQQKANWISNLDTLEKKSNVQKEQINSFIVDTKPSSPPAPPKSPIKSTRSLFVDNITRDKPVEVKPSAGKPDNLFFQQPARNTLQSPTQSKPSTSADIKTHDCPRCGTTLNKKFRFCNKCGSRIN